MLLTNGCVPQFFAKRGWQNVFQEALLRIQTALEDNFMSVAQAAGVKSVILCDRGLMDGSAYMDAQSWREQLERLNLSEVMIRDSRYDAVFHLTTAADGAEEVREREEEGEGGAIYIYKRKRLRERQA